MWQNPAYGGWGRAHGGQMQLPDGSWGGGYLVGSNMGGGYVGGNAGGMLANGRV
ncbi:hypothetical protein EG329_000007 [Mollisiaceae sp. DMI_Dod_QoI]|nr:hypothetical protein EG329_000007 [Helotiales sp. DMI_Dod_QoI]